MKDRTITLAGSAIIILLIIAGITLISNSKNKSNLRNEKLQNENLTSQRLQATQDLDKAKSDLVEIRSKEESSSKALADTQSKLKEKEKRIAYLSKENGSLMKDKNDLVQLQKTKMELDKAYTELKMEHQTSLSRISDLENSAIILDAEKRDLTSKLETSEMDRIDNVEIYGSRGNKKDKLTDIARRTKELNLNFDSPLSKTDLISYKIITPSGSMINPEDKTSAWVVVDHSQQKMTASLSSASGDPANSRQIELRDDSNDKLKPGEYKIQVFNNNKNIGTYRLKLR
jgi:hypothetical protein